MPDRIISILGDSRAFDTYYYNASYPQGYGYQETFAFLLRKRLILGGAGLDLVHIPDHFRGGTTQNNILRLGFTNPCCVVLLNGIWETLVNKGHFLQYVEKELKTRPTASGHSWEFSYSGRNLVDLFVSGQLENSPARYRERQRTIISYFRRRRRQAVNITLPMPDAAHLGRLHYAGQHQLIDEWDQCLAALNEAAAGVVAAYGARTLDAHELMLRHGGQEACLVDQWHFTPHFHRILATALEELLSGAAAALPAGHVSNAYMVPGCGVSGPVAVTGTQAEAFLATHPGLNPEHLHEDPLQVDGPTLAALHADVLVLAERPEQREQAETRLLPLLPAEKIIVYPEELFDVDNPLPEKKGKEG